MDTRPNPATRPTRPALAVGPLPPAAPAGPGPRPAAPRRLCSERLLGGAREIEIAHGPALYRLRLTALGKLILTK